MDYIHDYDYEKDALKAFHHDPETESEDDNDRE